MRMDLNPTFGAKELVETLSHGSSERKSPGNSASSQSSILRKSGSDSNNNNNKNNNSEEEDQQAAGPSSTSSYGNTSAYVDEAYRRLGQRLSLQAHGDVVPREPPVVADLKPTPTGGFKVYNRNTRVQSNSFYHERSLKVQKIVYSDNGDHQDKRIRNNTSILRKLTHQAKQTFRLWEQADRDNRKKSAKASSESKLSPQRFAFSQLSIGSTESNTSTRASHRDGSRASSGGASSDNHHDPASYRHERLPWKEHTSRGEPIAGKGLLSAVLEGHSDSNTSASGNARTDRSPLTSSASQSISSKGSAVPAPAFAGIGHALGENSGMTVAPTVRGKCLTNPSQPVSNDGHDNIDANLLVYENDLICVPRKGIHSLKPKAPRITGEFRVQSLLGQGTFAQVFQCVLVSTGESVAVKIIKNKPAYTRQATIEIDVFRALMQQVTDDEPQVSKTNNQKSISGDTTPQTLPSALSDASGGRSFQQQQQQHARDSTVEIICYFMYRSHLCLVFDLLGPNLYEVLKQRQFRGLPLSVIRSIVIQSVEGIKELAQKSIVHCDLKPENILLVSDEVARDVVNSVETTGNSNDESERRQPGTDTDGFDHASRISTGSSLHTQTTPMENANFGIDPQKRLVKLIDFGSACFEGYTAHTYIQSRFYRSPEVLIGLPYDSAIDMWSLGCVTAELFLGLPILPGVHEHDQLARISEMIAKIPDWMLEQGSKTTNYYMKYVSRSPTGKSPDSTLHSEEDSPSLSGTQHAAPTMQWRLKTLQEYISSLSQNEIKKKGGLVKLEKQSGNRYFRRTRLTDILLLHAHNTQGEDLELVPAFVHFLYGMLDPDPWKRWTAFQAMQHPFLTGALRQLRPKTENDIFDPKETNQANLDLDYYWKPPWDPAICRRKLLNVQKIREKQKSMRRNLAARPRSSSSSQMTGMQQKFGQGLSSAGEGMISGTSFARQVSLSAEQSTDSHYMNSRAPEPGIASVSLTSLVNAGGSQAQPGMESPSMEGLKISEAAPGQSSHSVGYMSGGGVNNQGEFGYALQRPGVLPAMGGDSVFSTSISGHSFGSDSYDQSLPQHDYQSYIESLAHSGPAMTNQTMVSEYGSHDQANYGFPTQQYPPGVDGGLHRGRMQFGSETSSAASSVTMEGMGSGSVAPLGYPKIGAFPQEHQQFMQQPTMAQMFGHQQVAQTPNSGQMYPMQLQQNQPFAGMPQVFNQGTLMQPGLMQQQNFQNFAVHNDGTGHFPNQQQQLGHGPPMPQQQQQQQFIPQQPIYLAQSTTAGGGFYYVATSATGQPIILQPVGVLNQSQVGHHLQQHFMDPNQQLQAQLMQQQGQQQLMQQQGQQQLMMGPPLPMQPPMPQQYGQFPMGQQPFHPPDNNNQQPAQQRQSQQQSSRRMSHQRHQHRRSHGSGMSM